MKKIIKSLMHLEKNIYIVKANQENIESIVLLDKQFGKSAFNRSTIKKLLSSTDLFYVMKNKNHNIIGYYVILYRKKTSVGRLYSIAIAENYQGCGLGKILLKDAEMRCIKHNIRILKLEVAENNKKAISLYTMFKYSMYDKISNYYPDNITAIRMKKHLFDYFNNSMC